MWLQTYMRDEDGIEHNGVGGTVDRIIMSNGLYTTIVVSDDRGREVHIQAGDEDADEWDAFFREDSA
jgi:hypothetical protein